MATYEIEMQKREYRTIEIDAETPQEAVNQALAENPGFRVDGVITEDLDEMEVCGFCEDCDTPILTGDEYYQWGGEEAVMTCKACGGYDDNHKLQMA